MATKLKYIGLIFAGGLLAAICIIALAYWNENKIDALYGNQYGFSLMVIEWALFSSVILILLFLAFGKKWQILFAHFFFLGFITCIILVALLLMARAVEWELRPASASYFDRCTNPSRDVKICRFKFPSEFFGDMLRH